MCTVVTRHEPGRAVRILAVRDELMAREFDDPGRWWPAQPAVVGGRDRQAGGSWCVSDVDSGVTALVLNRTERRSGSPSRGVLPLLAVAAGEAWSEQLDHRTMAAFTLLLAGQDGVTAWSWDTRELRRDTFAPGTHVVTESGVGVADARSRRLTPLLATEPWTQLLTAAPPGADPAALVVRRELEIGAYGTVFGQLIDAVPGSLRIDYSRTPWRAGSWQHAEYGDR